jgi:hypothetical protein
MHRNKSIEFGKPRAMHWLRRLSVFSEYQARQSLRIEEDLLMRRTANRPTFEANASRSGPLATRDARGDVPRHPHQTSLLPRLNTGL